MTVPACFFKQLAELDALAYPQDAAGGEIPTPSATATLVPCCVQQDKAPDPTGDQKRRGSEARVRVFFRPPDATGAAAVAALKVNDRVKVQGRAFAIVLDGPAFDAAGRGVVWEAAGRDIR